jgi:hypothetical protein
MDAMKKSLKEKLINTLRRIALAVEKGCCDEMTAQEYDDLISALSKLKQTDDKYIKPKRSWMLF